MLSLGGVGTDSTRTPMSQPSTTESAKNSLPRSWLTPMSQPVKRLSRTSRNTRPTVSTPLPAPATVSPRTSAHVTTAGSSSKRTPAPIRSTSKSWMPGPRAAMAAPAAGASVTIRRPPTEDPGPIRKPPKAPASPRTVVSSTPSPNTRCPSAKSTTPSHRCSPARSMIESPDVDPSMVGSHSDRGDEKVPRPPAGADGATP